MRALVLVSLFLQLIVGKKLTEFPEIASLLNDEHINGITQSQFLHHEAARKQRKGLLGENNDNDKDPQLHLFCTSTASDESEPLHQKHSNLKALMGINIDVMTIDKKRDLACYSGTIAKSSVATKAHVLEQYNFLVQSVPAEVKVHGSIMNFIEKNDVDKPIDSKVELEIVFYRPMVLPKSQPEEDVLKSTHVQMLQSSWQSINSNIERSDLGSVGGRWGDLREQYSTPTCTSMPVLNPASLKQMRDSIRIPLFESFGKLQKDCFMRLVEMLADVSEVGKMEIVTKVKALNFEARGLTQTGTMLQEPFSSAGLDGKGQIVGIADSGLSDLSCFFFDGSPGKSLVIDRNLVTTPYQMDSQMSASGVVDNTRRKVINYNYNSDTDKIDDEYGHGTHVAGSVLGNCEGSPSSRGMASGAKTSFFDIGNSGSDSLDVSPSIDAIFDSAKYSGAAIHTNSWGTSTYYYSYFDSMVDEYLYNNPDMLVLFAAGNDGNNGKTTVGSPAVAKNCITVGAMTVKQGDGDNYPISESTVADFSSLGPVDDSRYGIDVVAPGDPIWSAYSGSTSTQDAAVVNNMGEMQERAVAEMSGTSMATPVVAGVAAQMRQYLIDEMFWSRICNPHDHYCIKFDSPRGVLLKSMILHSGEAVARYRRDTDDNSHYSTTQLPSQYLSAPPNEFQGFGAVTMSNVLTLDNGQGMNPDKSLYLWENLVIKDNEVFAFNVSVAKSNADKNLDFKVTIAWYDPPLSSSSTALQALINDVDLLVRTPNGVLYYANGQDDGDYLNPVEQVHVTDVVEGNYTVYLIGNVFDSGQQTVSMTMTYPSHTYPTSKQYKYVTGPIQLSQSQLSSEIDYSPSMTASPSPAPPSGSVSLPARSPTFVPATWEDYYHFFPTDKKIGPTFTGLVHVGSFQKDGHLQAVATSLSVNAVGSDEWASAYTTLTAIVVISPEGKVLQAGGHFFDEVILESGVFKTEPWIDSCCTSYGVVPVGGADMYSTPTNNTWNVYLAFTPDWDASDVYSSYFTLYEKNVQGYVTFTFDTNHGAPTLSPTPVPPPTTSDLEPPTNFTSCRLPKYQKIKFHRAMIDYSLADRNGSLSLTGLEPMFYPRVRLLKLTMVYDKPDGTGKVNHHATKIFIAASSPTHLDEFHAAFEIIEDAWNSHPTSIRVKFLGDRMIGPPQPDGNGNLVWPDGSIADVGTKKVPSHNHLLGCFYFDPNDVSTTSHSNGN